MTSKNSQRMFLFQTTDQRWKNLENFLPSRHRSISARSREVFGDIGLPCECVVRVSRVFAGFSVICLHVVSMKLVLCFVIWVMAVARAQDVWYDAKGRPVVETASGNPGQLQPKDLIVTDQPLLRVSEAPWRGQAGNARVWRAQRSWWWLGPIWTFQSMPLVRTSCPKPCEMHQQRAMGASTWNFSYQSRGISLSFTPCR
jgi:hypothetical protein